MEFTSSYICCSTSENGLNQVTPGGAPANHFSLPASLNMHHFQVSRQVTMRAGTSSSLVTPSIFGTMEAGAPGNLVVQHSQVIHGISGTMEAAPFPNLLGQHSQVTRGASGTIGAAPPPNLVKQSEAKHGVN